MQDEHLYLQATQEVDDNRQNREIWSKSLAMTGGDHFKSKYTYIPLRVAQLLREQGIDPDTVPGLVLPTEDDFEAMDTGRFASEDSGSSRAVMGAGAVAGATAVAATAAVATGGSNTDRSSSSHSAASSSKPTASRADSVAHSAHPLDDLDDTMLVHNEDQQVDTGIWYSESNNSSDSAPGSNTARVSDSKPSAAETNRRESKMASSSSASTSAATQAASHAAGSAARSTSRLDNDPTLLPLSEFARLTGMSESDATLEIHRGSIASVTDDGAHYVKRDEVTSFVRKQAATRPVENNTLEEDGDYAVKWLFAVVFAVALAYALYRFSPALVALFPTLAG